MFIISRSPFEHPLPLLQLVLITQASILFMEVLVADVLVFQLVVPQFLNSLPFCLHLLILKILFYFLNVTQKLIPHLYLVSLLVKIRAASQSLFFDST